MVMVMVVGSMERDERLQNQSLIQPVPTEVEALEQQASRGTRLQHRDLCRDLLENVPAV